MFSCNVEEYSRSTSKIQAFSSHSLNLSQLLNSFFFIHSNSPVESYLDIFCIKIWDKFGWLRRIIIFHILLIFFSISLWYH